MHPGSASNEPGLLKTVKLIPGDKNRLKAVETVKKEKNYSLPRSDDFVSRISTGTREPKIKIETGKLGGKTDLHPLGVSLTVEKDGFIDGTRKFESFSRCLNSFTGEYDTDIGQGVQGNTEEEKKDFKIETDESGAIPFTFTADNFSATSNYEFDEYSEKENSKRTRANVDKISCTEIERLRIMQLLREHDLKSRLLEEKGVMEERRMKKKMLSQSQSHSTLNSVHFYPKKRIPFSGFNHAPAPIEKPLKAIPKYPPTPDYSKTEHVSFLHQSLHRSKKEENSENNGNKTPNLTDPMNKKENFSNNSNSEIHEIASVTSKNDLEFDSALTTARTISADTARTDNAAPVRTDTVAARADNAPVPLPLPVPFPVPPAVSEPHHTSSTVSSSVSVSSSVTGASTCVSTCVSTNVSVPATPATADITRYELHQIVTTDGTILNVCTGLIFCPMFSSFNLTFSPILSLVHYVTPTIKHFCPKNAQLFS
jgi:hypothetical protein